MNTILIEPLPHNYVRCTMKDQSTVTMEQDKLYEWLREHPMDVSHAKDQSYLSRLWVALKGE